MASTPSIGAPTAPTSRSRVFRVPQAQRVVAVVGVVVVAVAALAVSVGLFLPAALAWLDSDPGTNPAGYLPSLKIAGFMLLVLAGLVWLIMTQCRFTLRIDLDRLTFGSSVARSTMACEEVDAIRLRAGTPGKRKTQYVEVFAGLRWWTLRLGRRSVACRNALAAACPRAVLFGPGSEGIRRGSPPDPLHVRNRARMAWRHACGSALGALCTVTAMVVIPPMIVEWLWPVRYVAWVLFGAISIGMVVLTVREYHRALLLSQCWRRSEDGLSRPVSKEAMRDEE